jgi:hypothetical protein
MKKLLLLILLVLTLCSYVTIGYGQDLPSADAAMGFFVKAHDKGVVKWGFEAPSMVFSVEPMFWNRMTHEEKQNFCKLALSVVTDLREKGAKNLMNFWVLDMTSGSKLAVGRIYGKIDIYK